MTPATPAPDPAMIVREAEPLMIRVLSAYYVTDEGAIRDMRARGWSFGDVATAGNLAARSQRPIYQVARMYEDRRDWTRVAQDLSVPSDDLYAAANAPRYVMVRPTPEEESQMMASRMTAQATVGTVPPGAPAAATAQAGAATNGATVQAGAATNGATAQPGAVTTQPGASPVMLTPVERVASARLELMPREPNALLRHATATYYALPPSTVRELSARGWSMGDILIAGNLDYRSEATFEEVVALRDSGLEWSAVADRVGIAPDSLYQPPMQRRVTTFDYPVPYWERGTQWERTSGFYPNGTRRPVLGPPQGGTPSPAGDSGSAPDTRSEK